jgi:hypothetical protein
MANPLLEILQCLASGRIGRYELLCEHQVIYTGLRMMKRKGVNSRMVTRL